METNSISILKDPWSLILSYLLVCINLSYSTLTLIPDSVYKILIHVCYTSVLKSTKVTLFCSQPNLTIRNFGIFWNTGMNYNAGTTHKLKPSPIGPDILKSEHSQNLSFNTITHYFQNISLQNYLWTTHLPSHPNTLIHDTTQNITLSLSGDQMLLSLNNLIGCPNRSIAILGLCAITIPIFPRGIFCQRHLPPTLGSTC